MTPAILAGLGAVHSSPSGWQGNQPCAAPQHSAPAPWEWRLGGWGQRAWDSWREGGRALRCAPVMHRRPGQRGRQVNVGFVILVVVHGPRSVIA